MRKSKFMTWAFIATTIGFSACSNVAEEVPAEKKEIRLTSEIIPSRVTSLDYQSKQIIEGRQVGVTISGAAEKHENVLWNVEGNGKLVPSDAVHWAQTKAIITAYHPFNSQWTGLEHEFSVHTDQSTNAGYLDSDLLWATATSSPMDMPVSLLFNHKLAKINITLTSTEVSDLSDAIIYICGTQISAKFNPSTGELSATTSNVADIKASVTTESAYTASAIIIPQVVASETDFIKIHHQGKEYCYTLAESNTYESGKSYNFLLEIKRKGGDCEGNMNGGGNGWN